LSSSSDSGSATPSRSENRWKVGYEHASFITFFNPDFACSDNSRFANALDSSSVNYSPGG